MRYKPKKENYLIGKLLVYKYICVINVMKNWQAQMKIYCTLYFFYYLKFCFTTIFYVLSLFKNYFEIKLI